MISSIKHSSIKFPSSSSQFVTRKCPISQSQFHHLSILTPKKTLNCNVSIKKPLFLSPIEGIRCRAYEADKSQPLDLNIDKEEAAQKLKISLYFATWWSLNVVFNIYNKKVLNAFPYPWLTSTLSLAAGSLIMLLSWATKIADAPKTDLQFWKSLFPV